MFTAVRWHDLFASAVKRRQMLSQVHLMRQPSDYLTLCGTLAHQCYPAGIGECVYVAADNVSLEAGCEHCLKKALAIYRRHERERVSEAA